MNEMGLNISYIETTKRKYPLVMDLNVMSDLQEKYGSLNAWGELLEGKNEQEPNLQAVIDTLVMMINEAIDILNEDKEEKDQFVNKKQVGRIISEIGLVSAFEKVKGITTQSSDTGDHSKNM